MKEGRHNPGQVIKNFESSLVTRGVMFRPKMHIIELPIAVSKVILLLLMIFFIEKGFFALLRSFIMES